MFDKKIKVVIILEILGRPKEHIFEVMKQLVETIEKEQGIKVTHKKIHDPKKYEEKDPKEKIVPDREDLFTTFAEIEFEANSLMDLFRICFQYMPANVEVIEPEEFKLKNLDLNALVNEILRRLHNYDAIAKSALMNNQMLANQLKIMQTNQQSKQQANSSGMQLSLTANPKKDNKTNKKSNK
jgi:hypothetical protein